jgi:hypothetical protein
MRLIKKEETNSFAHHHGTIEEGGSIVMAYELELVLDILMRSYVGFSEQ